MKVSEALADALAVEAQGPIFGLMGDANMPVWGALCKDPRTRMVWSRHDAAAVLMADGYSQATGRLAVVTVTCGPGLANCANAILTAARAATPMVIFTGEYPADGGKAGLQAMDQRLFARTCEAEFRPLNRVESLAEDIAEGFFDGHPWDVGISGSFSSAPTEKLLADADFVLAIGASLNFFTSEGGMLFPAAAVARIDTRAFPAAIGAVPGLYVQGDARATTQALVRLLAAKVGKRDGFRTAGTRDVLQTPVPQPPRATDGIDPRELMRALANSLPDGVQVVSGGGHFWSWPALHLALPPGGRYQHSTAFGSIGLALGHGMGAAVGNPGRTTLVIEGDGSLLQSVQELHAAAEQNVPLIVLVMNDGGYGAEVLKMQWKGRSPRDAQWKSPDFVALARGFGGDGLRVDRVEDLPAAVAQALQFQGPFVIDARISPTTVNDSYGRLFLGQQNQAPLLRPQR